jgi:hypothetical protein
MNTGQIQLSEFIKLFSSNRNAKNNALLKFSTFNSVYNSILKFNTELTKLPNTPVKFDFVFVDLPFGMQREPFRLDESKKVNQNWNLIYDSLKLTNPNSYLFAVAEPSIYSTKQGREFLEILAQEGNYCNLIIDVPEKIYAPQTAFTPILLGFQKNKTKKLFVAKIDNENCSQIIHNYENNFSENLINGKWIERDLFSTFQKTEIEGQISNLQTQYKVYKQYKLIDIAESINLTREHFDETPNTIYIPKLGTSQVVSDINATKIKHQNLFQVVLKSELVLSEYLELFYRSEIGRLILGSLNTGTFIPNINKSSIQDSFVAIPEIPEQKILIHTNNKLSELQKTIDDLKLELSLNPKNAKVILDKFDSISGPLKHLSVEDEILALIRKGENKNIEFKETFSKDVKDNGVPKSEIQKSSLKNIVGFLNANGGTLLIGVTDDSEITGIEQDDFQSKDKYLLNFKNLLKSKIGVEYYPLIEFDLYSVLGKTLLKVDCKPSQKPCYYEGNEFYVRTNPATDKLDGRQLIEYVKRRFKE